MKSNILCHFLKLMMLLPAFTGISIPGNGQDPWASVPAKELETPHYKWIKQWPSPDKKQETHTFKSRFNAIFLGKKAPVPSRPVSVFAYNAGNFWVLDQGLRSVFHVEGEVGDIPHFIQKTDIELSSLVGICATPSHDFLFTDSGSGKVYKTLPDKKKLLVLNDSLNLDQPTGIACSPVNDEIYVVETNAHRLAVMNVKGQIIKYIGSRGTASGEFNYPTHIWIDKTGLIYVVDAMNFRVQVLDPTGGVVSVFGQQGDASGYFARPKGIATDSRRNIYIVDALFHVVQVFDLKGNYLSSLGTQGSGQGEFWMPSGIFIDDQDFIYIADSYNSRIQVFQMVY